MATKTLSKHKFWVAKDRMPLEAPEANNQTFKDGDLIYISSGEVTACGDNPTTIAGIAIGDANNNTAKSIRQYFPITGEYLLANTYEASNPGTKYLQALVSDGNDYQLKLSSNNIYVNLDSHSSGVAYVQNLVDTAGDAYGRVVFKISQGADQHAQKA